MSPAGIRVLAVSPGFTLTEMTLETIHAGAIDENRVKACTPQGRMLKPAEVAGAIVGLVGDDFSALTGNNVLIDCAFDAWGGRF
jgi:NAD(P)-dependent dehydrogenase (short-subunit alcohol dehydrogenase family)